eukprot:scaffold45504_cov70-Phaeocystis_antarctica.AAC.2
MLLDSRMVLDVRVLGSSELETVRRAAIPLHSTTYRGAMWAQIRAQITGLYARAHAKGER